MWSEPDSQAFIDYGRYFVPQRETQIQIICDLIPHSESPSLIMDLACGEGLLARAILEQYPDCTVHGLDGSAKMRRQAQDSLATYGERFSAHYFELADDSWRKPALAPQAVVSSLAIHHLDDRQKQTLFHDVFEMLSPGGAFLLADIILPAGRLSAQVAAQAWDEAVRSRALGLEGDERAFDAFLSQKWNLFRFPDPTDKPSSLFSQLKWLEVAGFEAIDVYWMAAGHAIYGGHKPKGQDRNEGRPKR